MTKPRAPADSPCELLPCPFCLSSGAWVERETDCTAFVLCNKCGAQGPCETQDSDDEELPGGAAATKAWNTRAAPPALSARPNEAVEEALACLREVAGSQTGSYWKWAAAIIEQWPKNEADAPRGQAVVLCQGTGTEECHFRMAQRIIGDPRVSVGMSVSDAPPPSPVGEADGVREKYRATTERDAGKVLDEYRRLLDEKHTSCTTCAMWTALNSVGAVVPQEPPK